MPYDFIFSADAEKEFRSILIEGCGKDISSADMSSLVTNITHMLLPRVNAGTPPNIACALVCHKASIGEIRNLPRGFTKNFLHQKLSPLLLKCLYPVPEEEE